MLIFRLETSDGFGPGQSHRCGGSLIGDIRDVSDTDPWDHPGPRDDFKPGTRALQIWNKWVGDGAWVCRDPHILFGCPSFTAFLLWFPRGALRHVGSSRGARVKVFWIDGRSVAKSNLQVAFDVTKATLLLDVRADVASIWPQAMTLRGVQSCTVWEN